MDVRPRRLGILAGGGALPREIADSAARQGLPVSIVAIDGEADGDFGAYPVTRVNWGQIGAMIGALKAAGATDLVIVGSVHRPELWGLKPDLGFFRHLPRIVSIVASGGDDGVLRRVVRFFEQQGLKVVGPGDAAPELVVGQGPIGAVQSGATDQDDIRKGLQLIRALGAYDIGQGVIVAAGRIEAIEGAEGTDRMITRAAERRAEAAGGARRGVLVKRSKPSQDMRVDMPAIGPATIDGAYKAGLSGIAVEAGRVLVAQRDLTLSRADDARLFVEGVDDGHIQPPRRFDPRSIAMVLRPLGSIKPRENATHDAIKGLATLDAMKAFDVGRAVIVVRNHVLAVEAGEGVDATLNRAAGLRQWASLTHRRRGVASLSSIEDLTRSVIDAVASAGYAGIAIAHANTPKYAAFKGTIADADQKGLFVLLRETGEESKQ